MASASGAMRLMRPVRTLPGPTSMNVVDAGGGHPLDRADPVDAGGEVLDELGPARRRRRDRAGVGIGEERRRSGRGTRRRRGPSRMPSAASAMSGEWAATDTGSTIARLAPSALASSAPASMAARSPETTTWPGELRLATANDAVRGRRATSSGSRASSRPMIAAIAPSRPCAGRLHLAAALADEPDAVGERRARRPRPSPSTGPSSGRRRTAGSGSAMPAAAQRSRSASRIGDRRRQERRLGVLGQVELLGRARPRRAR